MKNQKLLLVLALLVLACASAWAQLPASGPITTPAGAPLGGNLPGGAGPAYDPTAQPAPAGNTSTSGAVMDVLGGHGARGGCMFCHTPHSTGKTDAYATKVYNAPVAGKTTIAGGPYGTSTAWAGQTGFTWQSATRGSGVSGNIYLWNRAMTTVTYTTWDGGTLSGAGIVGPDRPEVHTLLCMTCHDNSMSSYAMTLNAGGQHGGWGAPVTSTNGSTSTSQDPGSTAIASLNADGTPVWGQGNLARNHPVHVKYSNGYNWNVSKHADGTVTYDDADTNQIGDSGFYGHPARLYTDGTDVYIECTSCHNPHRQTSPAYKAANGTYVVGAYGTTENYIRGPYSSYDGSIAAGFCRSCHFSKSPEYIWKAGKQ